MGNYWSTQTEERTYGWKRDTPSDTDVYHNFTIGKLHDSIKGIDLREQFPPVYNQGKLGSCTANGIAGVYEFEEMKQKEEKVFVPSRLFIYYNERKANNTIGKDTGASIRDSVMEISNVGVCPESLWPYDITKFKDSPPQKCYDDATKHKCIEYKRVNQDLQQLKQCLMEGFPMVCGIEVYKSFESPETMKTGIVQIPLAHEKHMGGHCIVIVGFDDNKKQFIFRNSWGPSFGENGYGYLPYDYLLNKQLSGDFWTVRKIQDDETDPNLQ